MSELHELLERYREAFTDYGDGRTVVIEACARDLARWVDEHGDHLIAIEEAAPTPEQLEEIAGALDFFDRVVEIAADTYLENEDYRAADHTAMQDDLRRLAKALRAALGEDAT